MHNAPSVSYPVGRCAFQLRIYLCLWVLTSCILLGWAISQTIGWVWAAGALAFACATAQGANSLLVRPAVLTWDGQTWCLQVQGTRTSEGLGTLNVVIDLQHTLLLEWLPLSDECSSSVQWLWLGAEKNPNLWQDLRCAVFSRTNG